MKGLRDEELVRLKKIDDWTFVENKLEDSLI
jgi:hypothetical protein